MRLHSQSPGQRPAAAMIAGMTDQNQIGRKFRRGFEEGVYYIAVEHETAGVAAAEVLRNILGQSLQGLGMRGGRRSKLRLARPAQDMDEAEFPNPQDARKGPAQTKHV